MCVHTGLCDVETIIKKNRREKKLVPTKQTMDWINNRNINRLRLFYPIQFDKN